MSYQLTRTILCNFLIESEYRSDIRQMFATARFPWTTIWRLFSKQSVNILNLSYRKRIEMMEAQQQTDIANNENRLKAIQEASEKILAMEDYCELLEAKVPPPPPGVPFPFSGYLRATGRRHQLPALCIWLELSQLPAKLCHGFYSNQEAGLFALVQNVTLEWQKETPSKT